MRTRRESEEKEYKKREREYILSERREREYMLRERQRRDREKVYTECAKTHKKQQEAAKCVGKEIRFEFDVVEQLLPIPVEEGEERESARARARVKKEERERERASKNRGLRMRLDLSLLHTLCPPHQLSLSRARALSFSLTHTPSYLANLAIFEQAKSFAAIQ